jgi:hypothetical protein
MQTIKTKSGRSGFINKPFIELTSELVALYTEQSAKESQVIQPILESSPELFKSDDELSIWCSIYADLDELGVSRDLSKTYSYKGCILTLRFYLEVRGCVEGDANMISLAYALDMALSKASCQFRGDIQGLGKLVDFAYFTGKTSSIAGFQGDIIAGASRTGEATRERAERSSKCKEIAIEKAKQLKKSNPKVFKKDIAFQICDEIGRRESTVLGYLKGVNLVSF